MSESARMPSPRVLDVCFSAALLAFAVLLWAPRFDGPIDLRYDAGVYYVLGTSLSEGKGYRLLNEPGEIEAVQYPPLLPLMVAAQQTLAGTSDPAVVAPQLRTLFFVLFLLNALAVYAMARQFFGGVHAFLIATVSIFYLFSYFLSDFLFAELPFTLVTALFVICNRHGDRPLPSAMAGMLAGMAYLLRSAGTALLAAWVAESLLARRWRQLAVRVAVSLVPVLAWQGYVAHVTSGDEYAKPAYEYQRAPYQYYNVSYAQNAALADPFAPEKGNLSMGMVVHRVATNVLVLPETLGEGVSAARGWWEWLLKRIHKRLGVEAFPPWIVRIPLFALGCFVFAGMGGLWFRGRRFVPLYVAASLGMICLTPWPEQFTRYLAPVTPFLAMGLVECLAALRRQTLLRAPDGWRWIGSFALAAVVAVVLVVQLFTVRQAYRLRGEDGTASVAAGEPEHQLFFYGGKWASFDRALLWLRDRAEPEDVIVTSAPHSVHLRTGARAIMPPMEADRDAAQRLLEAVPAEFVIIDSLDFIDVVRRYTVPAIEAHPERWQTVYESPDEWTRILQRSSGPEPKNTPPSAGAK